MRPGVLDHHQSEGEPLCTSKLVLKYPEFVLSQCEVGKGLTIVTHHNPDIDAIVAAWLVRNLLEERGRLSKAAIRIADMVQQIDRGETELTRDNPYTFYSVMMMFLDKFVGDDACRMQAGIDFLDEIEREFVSALEERRAIDWQNVAGEAELLEFIRDDFALFECDVEQGFVRPVLVDCADLSDRKTAHCLFVRQPKSKLFKSWVRGARDYAGEMKYEALAVQLNPKRTIISVAPDTGICLKSLGELLQQAEMSKHAELGQLITGENRPGYDSPDPWYDGRNALHQYTILDSPRAGTVLTWEEIVDIILGAASRPKTDSKT